MQQWAELASERVRHTRRWQSAHWGPLLGPQELKVTERSALNKNDSYDILDNTGRYSGIAAFPNTRPQ